MWLRSKKDVWRELDAEQVVDVFQQLVGIEVHALGVFPQVLKERRGGLRGRNQSLDQIEGMREHAAHLSHPTLLGVDTLEQPDQLVVAEHRGLESIDSHLGFTQGTLVGLDGTVDELDEQAGQEALAPERYDGRT